MRLTAIPSRDDLLYASYYNRYVSYRAVSYGVVPEMMYTNGCTDYAVPLHTTSVHTTPFVVAADREKRAIVVAIRGTLSMEDCVTDGLAGWTMS